MCVYKYDGDWDPDRIQNLSEIRSLKNMFIGQSSNIVELILGAGLSLDD